MHSTINIKSKEDMRKLVDKSYDVQTLRQGGWQKIDHLGELRHRRVNQNIWKLLLLLPLLLLLLLLLLFHLSFQLRPLLLFLLQLKTLD